MLTWKHFIKRDAHRAGIPPEKYIWYKEHGYRRCVTCKEWKSISTFPPDKSRPDGVSYRCSDCRKKKDKQPRTLPEHRKNFMGEWSKANKGRKRTVPMSEEQRKTISAARKKEGEEGTGVFYGSRNPNWKGGVTSENQILRNNADYRNWRTSVFDRDAYTCQQCGDNKGGNLEAHHIRDWKGHPELRYDIDNGVTVCRDCHAKIHDKPDSYRKRRKQKRPVK